MQEECLDIAKMCRVKIRALLAPEVHAAYEGIVQRMKGKGAPSVRDIMASRRAAAAGSTSSSSAASHCCLEALTELRRLMSTAKVPKRKFNVMLEWIYSHSDALICTNIHYLFLVI